MAKRCSNPMISVAYIRSSTDRQKNGPEAQRTAIEAWARESGIRIVSWHEDRGVSGGTALALRPALVAALASLRAVKAGVFVAGSRDRLGRNVVEVGLLEREVIRLGAVVRTADGKSDGDELERDVRDVFSAHEKREIRKRILVALANKQAKGERTGGVPYGHQLAADGVHLEADAMEQATIAMVRQMREAGLSLRCVVARLAESGVVSRVGKPFALTQVVRMLAA